MANSVAKRVTDGEATRRALVEIALELVEVGLIMAVVKARVSDKLEAT